MKNILLNDGNAIPAIGFGVYAAPNTTPLPNHNKRKELSETVSYL